MEHITFEFHSVYDQVQQNHLYVTHVHTANQLTDVLTKTLLKTRHQQQLTKLGVVETSPSLRGLNRAN